MSFIITEDCFEYLGDTYCIIDGRCYKNDDEIFHSDYAYIRNLYEHYRFNDDVPKGLGKEMRKYFENYVDPYSIYYFNDFNIKLYEHKKRKGFLVWRRDKNPETLRVYKGKVAALKSINVRHRYNNIKYGIEKIL